MTPMITYLTPEEIHRRRSELVTRTGADLRELRRRESLSQLTADEEVALRELENLKFLADE